MTEKAVYVPQDKIARCIIGVQMNSRVKIVVHKINIAVFIFSICLFWGMKEGECRKRKRRVAPKDESMLIIAEGLYRDGFYDAAVTQLNKFLKDFPRSKSAQKAKFLIGEAFYFQKDYERAEKEYTSFIQMYPESKFSDNSWLRLADCAYNSDKLEIAIERYKKIIRVFPKSKMLSEAYYWAGECFYQTKDYKESVVYFREFMKLFPKNALVPNALERLGRSSFSDDKLSEAIGYFKRLLEEYPKSPLIKSNLPKLGDAYYKTKEYLNAGEVFETLILDFPEKENIEHFTFYCGISFLRAGVYPCAITYLKLSIPRLENAKKEMVKRNVKFAPEPIKTKVLSLLESSTEKGISFFLDSKNKLLPSNSDKRKEIERKFQSIQNNVENAMSYCGNIYFRMSQFNEALASYQQLISTYPQSSFLPRVLYNSGLCFLELNKPNEALLYFRKLTDKFPENSFSTDAYLRSGVIYMRNKEFKSAILMLKKALNSHDPEINAEVNYYLGESYFKQNNLKDAFKSYGEVVNIHKAKRSLVNLASYRIAEIYLRRKNIGDAQKIYQKLLRTVKSSELRKLVKMRIIDINDFKRKNAKLRQ